MFTGIIENYAYTKNRLKEQSNTIFTFESPLAQQLKIDQSLAHNGVCLTVTNIDGDCYTVTAIQETLNRTNLDDLQVGEKVNLERCLSAAGRFDGHFVQGHVDQTAICTQVQALNGSWKFVFNYDATQGNLTVAKGSICINGVSLTVVESTQGQFSVAIIPYTYENTNFNALRIGSRVNLEFDIIGKYIQKIMGLYAPTITNTN